MCWPLTEAFSGSNWRTAMDARSFSRVTASESTEANPARPTDGRASPEDPAGSASGRPPIAEPDQVEPERQIFVSRRDGPFRVQRTSDIPCRRLLKMTGVGGSGPQPTRRSSWCLRCMFTADPRLLRCCQRSRTVGVSQTLVEGRSRKSGLSVQKSSALDSARYWACARSDLTQDRREATGGQSKRRLTVRIGHQLGCSPGSTTPSKRPALLSAAK